MSDSALPSNQKDEHGCNITRDNFNDNDRLRLSLSKEIRGNFKGSFKGFKQVLTTRKGRRHVDQKLKEAFDVASTKVADLYKAEEKPCKLDYQTEEGITEGVPIIPFSEICVNELLGTGSCVSGMSSDDTPHEVFISYQWDIQSTVLELVSLLKENGFNCWVDIGQMGGGDSLYAELDKGIRSAKVVISCITDKYCKSEICQRETTLADTIKKPIIPLLLEPIPWPPAGQLGLIFAKLLYIDMTQGYQAKMDELVRKIKAHTSKS